nr:hypothetical protein [Tanacetum cinerariifolium]
MVAYLSKSDVSEGFNQTIDFLNGNSIKYALTVNPNIYVSCIKQFWTTVVVKKVNDVIRLQALVDKKKVVVTKATIQEILRLDDVEGVECLPNKEICAELARMGYEKPSTKHRRLLKNEMLMRMMKMLMLMILLKEMLVLLIEKFLLLLKNHPLHLLHHLLHHPNHLMISVPLPKYNQHHQDHLRVKKLERRNKVKVLKLRRLQKVRTTQRVETSNEIMIDDVSNHGRMIADMDAGVDVVLEEAKEVTKDAKEDESKPDEVQEVVEVVTTAKIITEQQQIKQDEKYARELEAEMNKNIDWDEAIDHLNKKEKEDNVVKRYQAMKRNPQTKAQARKNMLEAFEILKACNEGPSGGHHGANLTAKKGKISQRDEMPQNSI